MARQLHANEINIVNARILDARSGDYMAANHVRVERGRIVEVSTSSLGKADDVIDLDGAYLLPGLCDAHVHVIAATANFPDLLRWSPMYTTARAAQIMQGMLMRGFTTVRDCGGADFGLVQSVDEGYLVGPRVLFCGHAISQTGGHGDMRTAGQDLDSCTCCAGLGKVADGVSEVRKACRDEIRKGAHFIKIMAAGGVASPTDRIGNTQFSEEEITAAVQEAQAAELYVAAHVYTARAANRALACGVRSIEHGNLIDDTTMDMLIEQGAFLVPTMSTHEWLAKEGVEAGMPKAMCDKVFDVVDQGKLTHAKAHKRGVKMVFGTDLLGSMHRHQLTEFEIRSAFQSPAEIIRSATVTAAELFRLEGEIGEIKTGALADLIAYSSDPLENIKVLQDPDRELKLVMKAGQVYRNCV